MPKRVLGFDLIRLASLIAIYRYHVESVGWYDPTATMSEVSPILKATEYYARALSFSGFTILILTCFLHGWTWKNWKKATPLFVFLLLGWIALNLLVASEYDHFWIWDIYPLIAVGLLTAPLAPRTLGVLGFFMSFVPMWNWTIFEKIPPYWRHIVIGNCARQLAEWPILPWVGIIWLFFALGRELKGRKMDLRWPEGLVATAVLAASTLRWGAYYPVPLDGGFGCHMFRQPLLTWWSHLIWPVYLMRLSLDSRVQAFLEKRRVAQWISSLAISRHFWFAYITHYLLVNAVFLDRGDEIAAYPWLCITAFFAILPATELITRVVVGRGRASLAYAFYRGLATAFLARLERLYDRR